MNQIKDPRFVNIVKIVSDILYKIVLFLFDILVYNNHEFIE